jgi:hypothetical protein
VIRLAIAVGVGYVVGGRLGVAGLKAIRPDNSEDVVTGAAWAGRVATFAITAAILGRVL